MQHAMRYSAWNTILSYRAVVLILEHASESLGELVTAQIAGLHSQSFQSVGLGWAAFVITFWVVLMLLAHRPHFEKHCPIEHGFSREGNFALQGNTHINTDKWTYSSRLEDKSIHFMADFLGKISFK